MSISSPRLQATLYGFPVPITIALITTGGELNVAAQYVGVGLLALFFFVVAAVADRSVGRFTAVTVAVSVYVGLAAVVSAFLPEAPLPTFLAVAACWAVHLVLTVRRRVRRTVPTVRPSRNAPQALDWFSVPITATLTWLLGDLLGSLIVTFPYSGVPLALTMRSGRWAFAHHFGVRAVILLVFLGVFHVAERNLGLGEALTVAWTVFIAITLTTLPGPRRLLRVRGRTRTEPAAGGPQA